MLDQFHWCLDFNLLLLLLLELFLKVIYHVIYVLISWFKQVSVKVNFIIRASGIRRLLSAADQMLMIDVQIIINC